MAETQTVTSDNKTGLSFKPEDYAADIAKLAVEQGVDITPSAAVPVETPAPVVTPTPPAQPAAEKPPAAATPETAKPVEIPEKFKTPDGQIDVAKVEKSTVNAEEALAKYLEKEKELKRKINEVQQKSNAYINPPPTIAPTPQIPVNVSFAQKLEEDIQKEGAGTVLAKLFTAAQEAAEDKMRGELNELKTANAETSTRMQVEAIGKKDPWVYTPEGMTALTKILTEQPYLWQAADPYKAAYLFHRGTQNVVSQPGPQVLTPAPQVRASAPVPTAQAASQTHTNPEAIFDALTPDQKVEFIDKLPVSERAKWYQRALPGVPAF